MTWLAVYRASASCPKCGIELCPLDTEYIGPSKQTPEGSWNVFCACCGEFALISPDDLTYCQALDRLYLEDEAEYFRLQKLRIADAPNTQGDEEVCLST